MARRGPDAAYRPHIVRCCRVQHKCASGLSRRGKGKEERRALTRDAIHPDLTAMRLDRQFTKCKSDARSTTVAGRRLSEELEDDLVKLGRDSTTCILHFDL